MTPDFACCPTPAGCLQPRTEVCFARAGGHAEPPGVARWTGLRLPWSAHVVLPREHDKSNSDCSSPKGHCHRARRRSLFCNRRLAGQRAALDIRRIERERRRQHLAHRGGRQAALLPPFVKECGGASTTGRKLCGRGSGEGGRSRMWEQPGETRGHGKQPGSVKISESIFYARKDPRYKGLYRRSSAA